jgi:hypothetical protein
MSDGQYRMEVRNAGPDVALGPITATLDIPNGLMPTAATGTNWTCALAARVTCTTPGPLGVGQVLPAITVPVRPLDPTTGTVTATATVTSSLSWPTLREKTSTRPSRENEGVETPPVVVSCDGALTSRSSVSSRLRSSRRTEA